MSLRLMVLPSFPRRTLIVDGLSLFTLSSRTSTLGEVAPVLSTDVTTSPPRRPA